MKNSQLYDRIFVAVSLSALVVATLRADDLYIWAQETMSGVTFFYSGSVDTTGIKGGKKGVNFAGDPEIEPNSGGVTFAENGSILNHYSVLPDSGRGFGKGKAEIAPSVSGDSLRISSMPSTTLGLPEGYTSSQMISGSMEFPGESLDTLLVDAMPFTFDTTLGDNTIHMFTMPPILPPANPNAFANASEKSALFRGIKGLQKKARKLKKKGKKAKAKKLKKKIKKLKKQLKALG